MSTTKGNTNIFSNLNTTLSPEDRISKAKIAIYRKSPFFSYILEHLSFIEDTKNRLPFETMGVNAKGECIYSNTFVTKLSLTHLMGVLAHEGMHVGMEHISRERGRSIMVNGMSLWNIAIDIVTNYLLLTNAFELPVDCLLPANNSIKVFDKTIIDISEKSAEDIYEELKIELKEMLKDGRAKEGGSPGKGKGKGQGTGEYTSQHKIPKGFDEHLKPEEGEKADASSQLDKDGKPVKEKDWSKIMQEANNFAKLAGNAPAGMERMFEQLHTHKLPWRTLLRRVIASKMPYDLTYSRPNKKYVCQDIFMPSIIGESVKVICSIDTSGSISPTELSDFISEMIGISRSFSQVDFRILTHDVEVHDDIKIYNGNINKIKTLQIHGGGGTSHVPLYEYIKDKKMKRETRLFVSFTDGYTTWPDKRPDIDTIIVLAGNHVPPRECPAWATTVCLE